MLERFRLRNFKQFDEVEIELGDVVVFIGPNNSGKTTALQALALWELGRRRWTEKRVDGKRRTATQRSGVTINRRDLVALPVPGTNLLWRDLRVREASREEGKQQTRNIRIDVEVDGITDGRKWSCGLEFDYANAESLYCRPLGWAEAAPVVDPEPIPGPALDVRIAYLQPMSGLAANETRLDRGAIQVRMGEGRTAEVLRNLCYSLVEGGEADRWEALRERIDALFGCRLDAPEYIPERGELIMTYRDRRGNRLDLAASGRGLQQTTLLIAFLLDNPGTVLLLDEPDAHLEVLRQRQIYKSITEIAAASGSQVIAASHSEIILNEAADRDVVVAFVGPPHRIDDRGHQVAKSLKAIGYEDFYQAKQRGWALYLEGSTDLSILGGFAALLGHPAEAALEAPFVTYVGNQPPKAFEHFYGLQEAKPDLVGLLITDRLSRSYEAKEGLTHFQWSRQEIENYLAFPEVLEAYAASLATSRSAGPLFESEAQARYRETMRRCVEDRVPPAAIRDPSDSYWRDTKATDELLDKVFEAFFAALELPNLMRKTDYHRLVPFVPREKIDPEVIEVLDEIVAIASRAGAPPA